MNAPLRPLPWLAVLLIAIIPGLGWVPMARAEEDPALPMPRWTKEELEAMRANPNRTPLLGELIGQEEPPADQNQPLAENGLVGDSPERSQPSADLSRFLPPSLLRPTPPLPSQPLLSSTATSLTEVPPEVLNYCFERPSTVHLMDPNHELSETTAEDFERFLVFHATDAQIPLKLIIIGRNQTLPAEVNLSNVAGGSTSPAQSALVVCPYGEVWRTRLFVSRPILDAVPADYLNSLLYDCIRDGQRATDPDEQLHRLLVRLSVRMFWMQRMLATSPATAPAGAQAPSPSKSQPLAEVPPPGGAPVHSLPVQSWLSRTFGGSAPGLLSLLAFAAYASWRWHRHKLRHYQWLLPEPDTTAIPAFGGASCGGGVSIRYR